MPKVEKTDIEKAYGLPNFLIPAEVLPEFLKWLRIGSYVKMSCTGIIREIEGQLFLQIESWKKL